MQVFQTHSRCRSAIATRKCTRYCSLCDGKQRRGVNKRARWISVELDGFWLYPNGISHVWKQPISDLQPFQSLLQVNNVATFGWLQRWLVLFSQWRMIFTSRRCPGKGGQPSVLCKNSNVLLHLKGLFQLRRVIHCWPYDFAWQGQRFVNQRLNPIKIMRCPP